MDITDWSAEKRFRLESARQALKIQRQLKYRLAIFDSDGTLADTLPWMRSIFNDLADEHDFRRVEENEFDRFRDMHGMALLREINLPLWKLPRVMKDMRQRMTTRIGDFALFPGIGEVLEQLSASGIRVAVVSSNSRENVERILGPKHSKLINYFGCGVSLFEKAAKLRQVVRASSVPREHTIYIGDEIRDAEAARDAGVAYGAVAWGQHSVKALSAQKPAEFFYHVREIAETLAEK